MLIEPNRNFEDTVDRGRVVIGQVDQVTMLMVSVADDGVSYPDCRYYTRAIVVDEL